MSVAVLLLLSGGGATVAALYCRDVVRVGVEGSVLPILFAYCHPIIIYLNYPIDNL